MFHGPNDLRRTASVEKTEGLHTYNNATVVNNTILPQYMARTLNSYLRQHNGVYVHFSRFMATPMFHGNEPDHSYSCG